MPVGGAQAAGGHQEEEGDDVEAAPAATVVDADAEGQEDPEAEEAAAVVYAYQRADGRRHDLDPIPPEERTWTTWSFLSLWISMTVSITTFLLVTSLLKTGLSYGQACLSVLIGSTLVAPALVLNGRAGARFGVSFPVIARASFGVRGSQIPALSRALVACGWLGINTWIGGSMLWDLTCLWAPPSFQRWGGGELLFFFVFGAVNLGVVYWGMEGLRRVLVVKGAILVLTTLLMLAWAVYVIVTRMDGRLDLSTIPPLPPGSPATSSTPLAQWGAAITSVAGSWATLALNIPDFARFAKNERAQILGQALGLPLSMSTFCLVCALVTAAAASYTPDGSIPLSPLDILAERTRGQPGLHAVCLLVLASSLMASNVAANLVGPAMDFANMAPRYLNFRRGALLSGLVGIAFCPWRLLRTGHNYINDWLVAYAVVLGPVLGVMLADYYIIRKQRLDVPALYARPFEPSPTTTAPIYWYTRGFNPVAIAALVLGILPTLPGMVASLAASFGGGKDVNGGTPSVWSVLYNFSWFVGVAVAAVAYVGLTWAVEGRSRKMGGVKEEGEAGVGVGCGKDGVCGDAEAVVGERLK